MKAMLKKTAAFFIALAVSFSLFGCAAIYKITAPKEYKTNFDINESYPQDALPVYEGSVVYGYESPGENIKLTAGSSDDFDRVSKFYMDYFDDNDITLTSEKDRSSEYIADGESGNYEFEITVETPSGKWEERLYNCIFEIKITKVNIANRTHLLEHIDSLEEDMAEFQSVFDADDLLEESEEDDSEYFMEEVDKLVVRINDLKEKISGRDVPDQPVFLDINQTELEMIEVLNKIFENYKELLIYTISFADSSADVSTFFDTYYEYYYDEFEAIIPLFSDFAQALEDISVPSFIEDFNNSFIEILRETVQTSQYCMDALEYGDNVRFYAGLHSYDINIRDFIQVFDDYDSDISIRGDRLDEDIENMKDIKNGISEWISSARTDIQQDSEKITELDEKFILGDSKGQILCDYLYPEKIIPANYRSLDYIAFLQLSTSKGFKTAKITVEIPGFTDKFVQKTQLSTSETEIKVHPPLTIGAITSLNTGKEVQLVITVEDLDSGELVLQETKDIDLYSRYDMQWYDDNGTSYVENILAWVTPEAPQVSSLLRASADSAYYLTGEMDSMIGYQPFSDWSEEYITYVQALAIMHALATEMNVKYIAEPFSSTSTSLQRVKTPALVIDGQGGLCAETAVTLASALQAMNMHPMLILLPGHMQVAVETWYGSCQYLLIETTALTSAANENFDDVVVYPTQDEWDSYLSQEGYMVIDCDLADQYGIKSIE